MSTFEPFDRANSWRRLGLHYSDPQEREVWERMFVIDTSADAFSKWLIDRIYVDIGRGQPIANVGHGVLLLSHYQPIEDDVIKIWVHCRYLEPIVLKSEAQPDSNIVIGSVIHFRVIPLGENRLKLTCSCLTPYALDYYQDILGEIAQCWPEIVEQPQNGHRAYKIAGKRRPNATRDAEIVKLFNDGKTRKDLAKMYSLTTERIKQIVKKWRRAEGTEGQKPTKRKQGDDAALDDQQAG